MPNWVSNTISIDGDKEGLYKIYTALSADNEFLQREAKEYQGDGTDSVKREMSFSNLVCPPEEIWDDYFTVSTATCPENNWYPWNNQHWNTKWDCVDVDVDWGETNLTIRFNTAWSPMGDELLQALADLLRLHGATSAYYSYEEEQGWGGEFWLADGYFVETEFWDIPQSHADYLDRDKECMCTLYPDDPTFRFDDCPKEGE